MPLEPDQGKIEAKGGQDSPRASIEGDGLPFPVTSISEGLFEEGKITSPSAIWDDDMESNMSCTTSPSVLPLVLKNRVEDRTQGAKAAHSREQSSSSSYSSTYSTITRTDTIKSTGAAAAALPRLSLSDIDRKTDSTRRTTALGGTPASEQRHPGKPSARISRCTQAFEPAITEEEGGRARQPFPAAAAAADGGSSSSSPDEGVANDGFLRGVPLVLLTVGLSLVVFLISIDRTIITTSIPFITGEFKSTADIGWYGSSYLLTACAFQPIFGRVFTLFDVKWSYLLSMLVFELGSILSGWAPSSAFLIIGRAIAGFGSAGILTGSFVIVATAVPLTARPIYTAVVGLMFGVGATVGPLIGGIFTDLLTWRWCFWINLPVGAVTIIVMILVYHPRPIDGPRASFMDRIVDLDLIGNAILLSTCVMLFLALEFTLTGVAWGSAKIIGLLVAAVVTTILFVVWLWWKQDGALIPPAIARQRTVAASCLMAFFTYGALLIQTYFLPIWFQAILGYSAIQSGVAMIPYFVSNALFSLFSGVFVSVIGYFAPPAIVGSAIGTIGCGIITLFNPHMGMGRWIGFEILASAGFGMSIQQGFTAVQTVLDQKDLAVGTAAVVASQSLGGAVFISVGNSIFQNRLQAVAGETDIPGLDIKGIIEGGAIAFRHMVSAEQLPILLVKYNEALQSVFFAAIPLGGLAFIACCFLEWKSVKPSPNGSRDVEKTRS
ncbi:major facilitator superfamily domain-containing protein [Biscogniauxia mediterranea]|nr:major facilitator superfamily domain-containing protein [Biscogniauxia mediterranea]